MMDHDLYDQLNLKRRQPLNIIHNLLGREMGTNSCTLYIVNKFNELANRSEQIARNLLKRVYLTVTPNYSILNVKIPNCFLRRFSPDGRYLVAFNHNLTGVQIFSFRGCSSGIQDIDRLKLINNNDRTDFSSYESDQFRFRAFDTYFKERSNIKLTEMSEPMHRECALFYKDTYLIVASASLVSDENLPAYDELAANNESIHYSVIENYTIYLVDMKRSCLCDKLRFQADKINLTHNQSLSLFRNVFAVLSQQNQTIYMYNLVEDGARRCRFVATRQIGRFCNPDDAEFIQSTLVSRNERTEARVLTRSRSLIDTAEGTGSTLGVTPIRARMANRIRRFGMVSPIAASNSPTSERPSGSFHNKPFAENCLTSMKQRIVSFFFKEALNTNTLSRFYFNLDNILKLKMYKMQLLDDRYILIKYVNMDHMASHKSSISITNRVNGGNTTTATTSIPTSSVQTATQPTTATTSSTITSIFSNLASGGSTAAIPFEPAPPPPPPPPPNPNSATSITTAIPIILNESAVPFYFVLFDTQTASIRSILKNNSSEMLSLFENFMDYFSLAMLDGVVYERDEREPRHGVPLSFHSLASNNPYANQILKRNMKNMLKFSSYSEMTKNMLAQLPISSQSFTTTPYLDHTLFSYDDKLISNMERPKPIGDQIIRFNLRESGRLSFRIYPGRQLSPLNSVMSGNQQSLYKQLVAFIWHPREPFCISIQRSSLEYNVNFHVYSK